MVRKQDARNVTHVKKSKRVNRIQNARRLDDTTNKAAFASELDWLLGDHDIFTDDVFHGNTTWDPYELVSQALVWSLQDKKHVTDAFDYALNFCDSLGMRQTAKSYPRFMNALTRYDALSARVRSRVQYCAEDVGGRFWRDCDWALFAFDGSRVSAMTVAELLALRRQIPKKRKKTDAREYLVTDRSLAETVRAIRSVMASPNESPESGKGLIKQLAEAVVQRYDNKTDKKSRYRPHNPDKKPLKDPDIRKITASERKRLRELDIKIAA